MEDHFQSLCSVLPHNYQLTIDKLKTIPQLLKDRGEQLSKLISSSSADVRKIYEKIITYLIVKLCYNDSDTSLVRLCDVMDESIDSTDTPTGMQQIRYREYMLNLIIKTKQIFILNRNYHPYKNIKVVQDCYNLVYKVVDNLVVTLSPHCDKLVFETCNSLVTTL